MSPYSLDHISLRSYVLRPVAHATGPAHRGLFSRRARSRAVTFATCDRATNRAAVGQPSTNEPEISLEPAHADPVVTDRRITPLASSRRLEASYSFLLSPSLVMSKNIRRSSPAFADSPAQDIGPE